ncbi:MAG: hypothetical protein KGV43_00865 [Arcobacter sp.]|nr:hypothetical protein [Arcobacter sp.]
MSLDILIPFLVLLVLVIYLIYTRNKFEKDILSLYEKKYEEWKENTDNKKEKKASKDLVGLVFKEGYKIKVELLDESIKDTLEKSKFSINKFQG